MLVNNTAFKYETQYNGPFEIIKCWDNVTFILKCGETNIKYNICHIKPYTYGTKIKYIMNENGVWWFQNLNYQLYMSVIYIKA